MTEGGYDFFERGRELPYDGVAADSSGTNSYPPATGMSEELRKAIEKMQKLRGPASDWLAKSNAVSRFVADLNPTTRVFCYGEVHTPEGQWPAVLTHNTIYHQTWAWAPSGRKGAMTAHHEMFFYSTIPHVGIAREVFAHGTSTATTVTA